LARIGVNDRQFNSVQFARISPEQGRRIHWASLEILERHGVRLHDQAAIDLLEKGGADVDDGNLIRVSPGMVERAFGTAPQRVVLCDRHGQPVMPLEGNRCFYGPGSDCMNIIDHRTGERRKAVLEDVVDGAIVCDALSNIDFLMSMVMPSDVDPVIADVYSMEALLAYSTKPIITVTYELEGLVTSVEMAEAVVGGADALRRNPMITCYINAVSGINHNAEALQKLIFLAGKGLPALYVPSSTGGVTCPITPAGAAALDNSGVLLGLVLSQLVREGTPYIMPGMPPSPMDMRTMTSPYFDPERGILQAMARLYGLPAFGLGGASDSKVVDQQAAAEAALTLLAESLVGGNIIHDLGYLESGLTYSLVQLVICEELIGWIASFLGGVEVTDETLALDVIAQTGPEGHFLNKEHTRQHFRDLWYPRLLDRSDHKTWQSKGAKTLGQRAKERVTEILQEHQPELLPDDARKRLREILRAHIER
jgi:trimethylamine--corrinoid protein Co-methyltransferase